MKICHWAPILLSIILKSKWHPSNIFRTCVNDSARWPLRIKWSDDLSSCICDLELNSFTRFFLRVEVEGWIHFSFFLNTVPTRHVLVPFERYRRPLSPEKISICKNYYYFNYHTTTGWLISLTSSYQKEEFAFKIIPAITIRRYLLPLCPKSQSFVIFLSPIFQVNRM